MFMRAVTPGEVLYKKLHSFSSGCEVLYKLENGIFEVLYKGEGRYQLASETSGAS